MDTLKKAGAMLAHLDLFHHMLDLRGLLQLAAHMEDRGDRVTLINPQTITLIGTDMHNDAQITTTKGATIQATTAYRVLQSLKGHEAPEYAVTREELAALNARAVAELGDSDALRAFEATLTRISAPTDPAAERPAGASRGRRAAEPETSTTDQPAA
ncbi:multidrug DMT transporter [Deinococcus taeanensis]|uniref:multidrug DMT transporter n=1 Tax=Deinococcus taeanensis TaxID=2737050 RepID=UPI001CDBC3ED|nr:multidrug DMT transporter [Deinococcus taeanensis]UBV42590.1 multidrug DMT transporter [Deinococcus taeanensis]